MGNKYKALFDKIRSLSPPKKEVFEKEVDEAGKVLNKLHMKEVDEVGPPPLRLNPESNPEGLNRVKLTDETKSNIEAISRTQGNKKLNENAMDRALGRQTEKESPVYPKNIERENAMDKATSRDTSSSSSKESSSSSKSTDTLTH